ncbi:MAG TPA: extracellular solute-binding protein [Terriglobales bacterium]|nr:extracellular solute-binding protein [Terriglobales bacterium]
MAPTPPYSAEPPKLTPLGKLAIIAFVAACAYGAYYLFTSQHNRGNATGQQSASSSSSGLFSGGSNVTIGVAYGTEKRNWLEWAVQEFAKTKAGKNISVNLIPMGSLEGAHAILDGDQRINAWSPASDLYKDQFVQDWQVKRGGNPIAKEEQLALSPMVFVWWDERYQAFIKKYPNPSLDTIEKALNEKGGWAAIANKPEWGLFKFGHTNPNDSNSGLMTIVLAAYSFHQKTRGLTLNDVVDVKFQNWLSDLERGVSGMSNSTGNMMREMVLKGPSSFDALLVYESVAIDYLKNAEGRWGNIRVTYPQYNAWNDNPYYILDVPWSTPEQRKAEQTFLDFLVSEPIQRESLKHGFRPANTNVAVRTPDSPFTQFSQYGVQLDIGSVCEPPKAEVVSNLLASWQRSQSNR